MRDFKLPFLAAVIAWVAAPACLAASQRPIAELKPLATLKLGETADWVAITADAVWVASTVPFAVNRISLGTPGPGGDGSFSDVVSAHCRCG